MVPFSFSRFELAGTKALVQFDEKQRAKQKRTREQKGDEFGTGFDVQASEQLFPCFSALFQGDHLGVEFALEAHQNLLREESLLLGSQRLQGHSPLPYTQLWESLIIDDYFAVGSCDKLLPKEQSSVFHQLAKARLAYEKHNLPGSLEKDVVAEDLFKAAGAECDSRDITIDAGLTLVGAPLVKRLGLSVLSLRVASLPMISSKLASRLAGSWVSVLLYRRCISSVVTEFFSLATAMQDEDILKALPRQSAMELAMLACLVPLAVSDIATPVLDDVFATDSSMQKGAIVVAKVSKRVAEVMWLDGDRKGSYTRLDNGFRAALKSLGEFDDVGVEGVFHGHDVGSPEKPPLFRFEFIEVFGGAGKVSRAMSELGHVCGPVLDISISQQYDLASLKVIEWLIYMLENDLLGSILCEPPCTTFSPAAHPAVRSYAVPLGWNRNLPKVLHGNTMAFRALTLLYVCWRCDKPGGLEQTRLSKMAWLSAWLWLKSLGCEEAVVASCQFGSPHRKEFRLLLTGVDAGAMEVKCPGGHSHLRIEGKFTKPSAVYTDGVAMHFAKAFSRALKAKRRSHDEASEGQKFESVLTNDVLAAGRWQLVRDWFWKSRAHINILETSVVVSLLKQMMSERFSSRFSILLDSAVAKGALSKGRSSSLGLQPLLQRAAACQLAGNLYPSHSFAPTRLNVADDPTRLEEIRQASAQSLRDLLPLETLRSLHWQLQTRPLAGWLRLFILLVFVEPSTATSPSSSCHLGFCPLGFSLQLLRIYPLWIFVLMAVWIWIFLQGSLGLHSLLAASATPKTKLRPLGHLGSRALRFWILLSLFCGAVAPMVPGNAAELERAARRSDINLAPDRVVRQQTRENRVKLLEAFKTWLSAEHGVGWSCIFDAKPVDAELICKWLVSYGREMHAAGKSYSKYSETVTAIATYRPILKRQLGPAWDLAFAWLVDEPHQHHPALPLSLLVAMCSLAILWGWPLEAAVFSMAWSGLLRIGELVGAKRCDLILPSDSAPGINYILLRIQEPKTRGKGARHQCAKIEPSDIVALISAVFQRHSPSQKLWPLSAQTLRRRFNQLLAGIGLPTKQVDGARPYDLGSLRPGGATHLLNQTEDCGLVQRRGRWLSYKVMTIYLQEIGVATSLQKLDPEVKCRIDSLNSIFAEVLQRAIHYLEWRLPCQVWPLLFQGESTNAG